MGSLCQCPEAHEFLNSDILLSDSNKEKRHIHSNSVFSDLDIENKEENISLIKSNQYHSNKSRMKSCKRKFLLAEKNENQGSINYNSQSGKDNLNSNLYNQHKSLDFTNNSINECKF